MATVAVPKNEKRSKWGSMAQRQAIMGLVYITPWILGYLIFNLGPNIASLYYSFTKYTLINPPEWIGSRNYVHLVADPVFWLATRNTLIMMFSGNVIVLGFGLLTAISLASNPRGGILYRTILYLPTLVVPVAIGMMMRPIYTAGSQGLLNQIVSWFGGSPQKWIDDPNLAVWSCVGASIFGIGGGMVIFLAGLKGINREYYEAAMIDGAGPIKAFRHVTIPLLAPIMVFQLVTGLISGIQTLDVPMTLSGVGGVSGAAASMGRQDSLATLVFDMYTTGFKYWQFGEASAIAWMVFGLALILTLVVFKLSKEYSFYGDQV